MSKVTKNLNRINYRWSVVGGLFFLVNAGLFDLLSFTGLIKNFSVFVYGVLFFSWIFFWYNKIADEKNRMLFLIVLLVLFPIVVCAMIMGNSLGLIEKFVFGFIPPLLVLPIYYFLVNKRDDIMLRILALIFAVLAIFIVVFINRDILNFNNFKCAIRGSNYRYGICEIDNVYSFKRNLFGLKIIVPQKDGEISVLSRRVGDNLVGDIFNIKNNNKAEGKVTLFPENISLIDDIRMTVIPFAVELDKTNYYLGLFDTRGDFNNNGLRHIDSYLIGENIKIGDAKIDKGYYNNFFTQTFFDSENKKQELRLRVGGQLVHFYLDKNCEEVGQIIEKTKGDGQKYNICVLADNKQCEIENYKKGGCPLDGFDVSGHSEASAYCLLIGNYPIVNEDVCYNLYSTEKCPMESYFMGECGL